MKATTLFKPCLLACSFLAGADALAGPTINSIEFSFMSYSSTPSPFFSGLTASSLDNAPKVLPEPVEATGAPAILQPEFKPEIEAHLPSLSDQAGTAPLTEVSLPTQAAAVIPEPATLALFGLGLAGLLMRRREGFHD